MGRNEPLCEPWASVVKWKLALHVRGKRFVAVNRLASLSCFLEIMPTSLIIAVLGGKDDLMMLGQVHWGLGGGLFELRYSVGTPGDAVVVPVACWVCSIPLNSGCQT